MGNNILTLIFAFIGGGVVTLFYELIKDKVSGFRKRQLFLSEIVLNLKAMRSFPEGTEWMKGDVFTTFYDTNSESLLEFKSGIAAQIIVFYGFLKLYANDESTRHTINLLEEKGFHEAAEEYRKMIARNNTEERERIIKAGRQILQLEKYKWIDYIKEQI
jgi:hypothetical protein